MRSKTFASRCTGRRWPSRLRLTRPASSSTLRCLETAWTVTSYGAASSPTDASPADASRATRSRLVGSARAWNTRESWSVICRLLNLSVEHRPWHGRPGMSTDRLHTELSANREQVARRRPGRTVQFFLDGHPVGSPVPVTAGSVVGPGGTGGPATPAGPRCATAPPDRSGWHNPSMPTALITGITGQDGLYLAELLLAKGYEVFGLIRGQNNPKRELVESVVPGVRLLNGDLTDLSSLMRAFAAARPDEVYNLGAVSFVAYS